MYKFRGKVIKGNKRGKELGFPTANVRLSKEIPEGIYISKTKIDKVLYSSITFIGRAITFNEKVFQAETYILSFDKNLYNSWISVNLLKKIRDNKKFDSKEELILQMKKDREVAIEFFKKNV